MGKSWCEMEMVMDVVVQGIFLANSWVPTLCKIGISGIRYLP